MKVKKTEKLKKPDKDVNPITFSEYLEDWLNVYCEPNPAKTTIDGYKVIIYKHNTLFQKYKTTTNKTSKYTKLLRLLIDKG